MNYTYRAYRTIFIYECQKTFRFGVDTGFYLHRDDIAIKFKNKFNYPVYLTVETDGGRGELAVLIHGFAVNADLI